MHPGHLQRRLLHPGNEHLHANLDGRLRDPERHVPWNRVDLRDADLLRRLLRSGRLLHRHANRLEDQFQPSTRLQPVR